jgi:hypothetical protein
MLVRPMKQDLGHAPSRLDFSKLGAAPRRSGRSVVSRAEVGLPARLERSIAGNRSAPTSTGSGWRRCASWSATVRSPPSSSARARWTISRPTFLWPCRFACGRCLQIRSTGLGPIGLRVAACAVGVRPSRLVRRHQPTGIRCGRRRGCTRAARPHRARRTGLCRRTRLRRAADAARARGLFRGRALGWHRPPNEKRLGNVRSRRGAVDSRWGRPEGGLAHIRQHQRRGSGRDSARGRAAARRGRYVCGRPVVGTQPRHAPTERAFTARAASPVGSSK